MRRFVIYGAGAVGGAIGAELALGGNLVTLVARGAHREQLATRGLEYITPDGTSLLELPVVERAVELELVADDVVIIATKSQDTLGVLDTLDPVAPRDIAIVCAQNGVANEEFALRRFPNVYGMAAVIGATHLQPGQVVVHGAPIRGILHLGHHPTGIDALTRELTEVLDATRLQAVAHDDIPRWKYTKLLGNLINAAQAVLEREAVDRITERAREEGRAAFAAAGIDYVPEAEFASANAALSVVDVPGHARAGGSTWQSLARGAGTVETDYLSGEIVLLGRRLGVSTPVNELLQHLANEAARAGTPPGALAESEFVALLQKEGSA